MRLTMRAARWMPATSATCEATWSAATLTVLRDQALSLTGQEVDIANVAMILWYLNGETKAPINKFIVKQPAWEREATFPSVQRTAGLETEVTPRFMGSILGSASRTRLMEGAQQRVLTFARLTA